MGSATDILKYLVSATLFINILAAISFPLLHGTATSTTLGFNGYSLAATIILAITGMAIQNVPLVGAAVAWTALAAFFDPIRLLLTGVPEFLESIGTPTWFTYPLYTLIMFSMIFWIIGIARGQVISEE